VRTENLAGGGEARRYNVKWDCEGIFSVGRGLPGLVWALVVRSPRPTGCSTLGDPQFLDEGNVQRLPMEASGNNHLSLLV